MELIKHLDIFDPQSLHGGSVGIIGVGALGSAVALEIAKLGVENITLYDPDSVAEHNLPNQILYGPNDVGEDKIEAAADMIEQLTGYRPAVDARRIGYVKIFHEYIFCCVDSMMGTAESPGRAQIFDKAIFLNHRTKLYIDGRMGAKIGWGYIIDPRDPMQVRQYCDDPDVMFPDEKIQPEVGGCGVTISIGATAHILAGMLTWMFMQAIKDQRKVGELVFRVDPWMVSWRPFTTAYDGI